MDHGAQQQLLALLREAFAGQAPTAALAALARIAGTVEPGEELLLVVGVGGASRVVNRREMLKGGGALVGISLGGSVGWPYGMESWPARRSASAGVGSLHAIVQEFRALDDEVGPEPLRAGVASHLHVVESLRG